MDPVSVAACSWAVAGIPKRGTKGMPSVKKCRGYISSQQSSGGQAWRPSLQKLDIFTPPLPLLHGSVLKHCPGEPIAGQQQQLHGMSWLW